MKRRHAVHFIVSVGSAAPCGKTAQRLALSTRFTSLPGNVYGCRLCLLAAAKYQKEEAAHV